jgi:hypothetical protein
MPTFELPATAPRGRFVSPLPETPLLCLKTGEPCNREPKIDGSIACLRVRLQRAAYCKHTLLRVRCAPRRRWSTRKHTK